MAVNILYWIMKENITNLQWIDISPDVHVSRVFKRCGLVSKNANREEIIWRAKEYYPTYPGLLDIATFKIGKEICRPQNPLCTICPLTTNCPKII
jgi:endonuclease III